MQRDISTSATQGGFVPTPTKTTGTSTSISAPLMSPYHTNGIVVPSLCSQSFPASSPLSQPSQHYASSTTSSVHNHQHYQDIINRHSLCLSHLREAAEEVESLRQENSSLRCVNRELNQHLSFLIQTSVESQLGSTNYTAPFDVVDRFGSMSITGENGNGSEPRSWDEDFDDSPTSVIESKVDLERISLPKSISVRSSGYLKVVSQAGSSRTRNATRPRTPVQVNVNPAQKVFVPGVKKEEKPLELEVYNQGMYKTELCNKWQETGACPYGEHCQFAHGIEELRPVIRHPRYKTEVCRMVLAGVICPYGHRCHFRHALTEEERLMGQQLKPGAIKLGK